MKRALTTAVRDQLRLGLALTEYECDLRPGGRPPPAGWKDRYVAVHSGGQANQSRESLDRTFEVQVTVTLRVSKIPYDRTGVEAVQKAEVGLEDLCEKVIRFVHNNHAVRQAANDIILASSFNLEPPPAVCYGFNEALILLGDDGEAHEVTGEWFGAKASQETAGLVQVLTFGEARRIESIGSLRD